MGRYFRVEVDHEVEQVRCRSNRCNYLRIPTARHPQLGERIALNGCANTEPLLVVDGLAALIKLRHLVDLELLGVGKLGHTS